MRAEHAPIANFHATNVLVCEHAYETGQRGGLGCWQQKRQVNMMAVGLLGFDSNMQNQIQACGPCASVLCISLRPVCRQMHASVLVKQTYP